MAEHPGGLWEAGSGQNRPLWGSGTSLVGDDSTLRPIGKAGVQAWREQSPSPRVRPTKPRHFSAEHRTGTGTAASVAPVGLPVFLVRVWKDDMCACLCYVAPLQQTRWPFSVSGGRRDPGHPLRPSVDTAEGPPRSCLRADGAQDPGWGLWRHMGSAFVPALTARCWPTLCCSVSRALPAHHPRELA